MAFTRDWLSSWILDHSKFKTQPSYVRGLMDDVGERLAAYLYGFNTGETFTGFKKVSLVTIGTGAGTIPTGTGVETAINVQGRTIDGKVELITIYSDGNEIQLTSKGGLLANNAFLKGNKVGTGGNVNILKIDTAGGVQMGQYLLLVDTGLETGFGAIGTGAASDFLAVPLGYLNLLMTEGIPIPTVAALPAAGTGNAGTMYLLKASGTGMDKLYICMNTGGSNYGMQEVNKGVGDLIDKTSSYGAQIALTDGFVNAYGAPSSPSSIYLYSDANADPVYQIDANSSTSGLLAHVSGIIKKGNYWKVEVDGTMGINRVSFTPLGS